MKKLAICALFALIGATTVHAQNWAGVRSGALARVGGSATPALFFYGAAGEKLTFQNLNEAQTPLYCGIAAFSNSNALVASGTSALTFTAPRSDLYLSVCMNQSTQVTDVILAAFTQAFFSQQAQKLEQPTAANQNSDPALDAELLEVVRRVTGQ